LAAIASQLAKPALHAPTPHAPIAHVAAALAAEHTLPHIPQLLTLLLVSTQLIVAPLVQIVPGAGQSILHAPITHICPIGHAVPQAPQFNESAWVSTHAAPQSVRSIGQPQVPLLQPCPAGHALPHVPQLLVSACRSTHVPPQLSVPATQRGPLSIGASGAASLAASAAASLASPASVAASALASGAALASRGASIATSVVEGASTRASPASLTLGGEAHAASAKVVSNSGVRRSIDGHLDRDARRGVAIGSIASETRGSGVAQKVCAPTAAMRSARARRAAGRRKLSRVRQPR
jgi:hypothetical protein